MRRTSKVVTSTCAALLLGLATVSAQEWAPPATRPPAPGSGVSPKPFERLFAPPAELDPRFRLQLEAARRTLKDVESGSSRRFICGMPVLQADPTVDPTSIVRPPETGTRFEIRTVLPTCR